MPHLADFPSEIIEIIAHNIESLDDIVSFALSCKALAAIAHPRHTQFRLIQCRQGMLCIWDLLSKKALLARHVRTLEIRANLDIGHRPQHAPVAFITSSFDDCFHCTGSGAYHSWFCGRPKGVGARVQEVLVLSLKNMTCLTSFNWSLTHVDYDLDDMWAALSSCCPNLREVSAIERRDDIWDTKIFDLSNLTAFDYTSFHCSVPVLPPPKCPRLVAMLRERCPHLTLLHMQFWEEIQGGFDPPDVGSSLFRAQWSELKSLSLRRVPCSVNDAVAFLAAHPGLRHLTIDEWFACHPTPVLSLDFLWDHTIHEPLPCLLGTLPALESLQCLPDQAVGILRAASSGPRVSNRLVVTIMPDYNNVDAHMDKFLSLLSNLPPSMASYCVGELVWHITWVDL